MRYLEALGHGDMTLCLVHEVYRNLSWEALKGDRNEFITRKINRLRESQGYRVTFACAAFHASGSMLMEGPVIATATFQGQEQDQATVCSVQGLQVPLVG